MSSLSVGIIGLPNVGKSTLFNALLGKAQAQVASYPFTTIEPNIGNIVIPDSWLNKLAKVIHPEEIRPATVTIVDIAGLVKGAHEGQGLGNQFLAHIRETAVLVHMIDYFSKTADLTEDLETVHLELVLKDFETVSRKKDALAKATKARKKTAEELALETAVEKLSVALGEGQLARNVSLTFEESRALGELFLLTMKPEIVVINVAEEVLIENQEIDFSQLPKDSAVVILCAKLELDLLDLDPRERKEYLKEMSLPPSNLDRVTKSAYHLLDLITFYTIKGGKIVQAWPIKKDTNLLDGAAMIHSDLAEKFIVADTIAVQELLKLKSWKEAKETGRIKTCGREDLIEDGWVVEIKI